MTLKLLSQIRGRGSFSLLSASSKWLVAVPREGETNGTVSAATGMETG